MFCQNSNFEFGNILSKDRISKVLLKVLLFYVMGGILDSFGGVNKKIIFFREGETELESDPVEKLLFDSIADASVRETQQRNLSHVVSPRVALLCSKSVSTILPGFMVNDIVYQDVSTFAEEDFVGNTQTFGSYGISQISTVLVMIRRLAENITNDDVKQILFSLSFSLMNNVRTKLPNTLYKYLA